MDKPARKRRRTTPPEERERRSSPLKIPPRRPSFASPTKASLARFNPNLLASSSSTPKQLNSREKLSNRGNQAIFSDTADQGRRDVGFVPDRDEQAQVSVGIEEQDPFKPKTFIPRSPRRAVTSLGDLENTEVELPSTPSLRALAEQDTPRRGILFSSPSKRPPLLSGSVKQTHEKPVAQVLRRGKSTRPLELVAPDDQSQSITDRQKQAPLDPEIETRKQEASRLLQELKDLENEVIRCTHEIDKLQSTTPAGILKPWERDSLIAFINHINSSGMSAEKEQAPAISNLLCSFLPFTARLVPPHKPVNFQQKSISSHRPLQIEDPLPYLALFTSLDFVSNVSLGDTNSSNSSDTHMYQKHTINITDPQRLFKSSVSATINSATANVIELSIQLPGWAEHDLGIFTRLKEQENDISAACWAIGSYWDISKKRAEFWHQCQTKFAHLIPGRTNKDTENNGQRSSRKPSSTLSRKELRQHLGRDTLILQDKHVLLRINWYLTFDWTGEAESEISINSALPAVWSEVDDNNSLKKIPETFKSLLRRKSVFEATKAMVALLFEAP